MLSHNFELGWNYGILYIKELYVLILLKINSIEKFWLCDSGEAQLHVYWIKMLSPGRAFSCNLESQVQVQEPFSFALA